MALFLFLCIIIWCLIGENLMSHTIDCSLTECKHRFVNCLPREDCLVLCSDTQSCMGAVINCPLTGKCQIQCIGVESCEGITIDATLSSGTLNIFCDNIHEGATDECRGMKVYGSTKNENTGDFNVSCNGFWRSCIHSEITCPFNGNCSISCNGDTSCKYTEITGPIHGNLDVSCNGPSSCFEGIVNGATSNKLSITGCQEYKSCFDLSLYCPSNTNGQKNCRIEGNDNLGRDIPSILPTKSPSLLPTAPTINPTVITLTPTSNPTILPTSTPTNMPSLSPTPYPGDGVIIYAVNGWKDIDIHYSGSFGRTHDGKMICGENYGTSCDIASDNWSCRNINEICNNVDATYSTPSIPTNIPLIYPTLSPTLKPTTIITTTKTPTFRETTTSTTIQEPDTTKTTYILQQIVQQTQGIDIISVSNDTIGIVLMMSKRENGELMVLGGVGLVVLCCMCVGLAQVRRECKNDQDSTDISSSNDDEEYEDYESSQYQLDDEDKTEMELSTISEEEDEYRESEDEHQILNNVYADVYAATP